MSDKKSDKVSVYIPQDNADLSASSGDFGIIEQAMRNLNPEQKSAIAQKVIETALELEKTRVEQRIKYEHGKEILKEHAKRFDNRDKNGVLVRHDITTEANMGGGKIRMTSKSGATCFVATAAFCDADHQTVRTLCRFRDKILINYRSGRAFVGLYWKVGPILAKFVDKNPWTKPSIRTLLTFVSRILPG
jgi:hypothetical protein